MKTKCPACGKSTEEGAFCERCGAPLGGENAAPAASVPASAAASVPASAAASARPLEPGKPLAPGEPLEPGQPLAPGKPLDAAKAQEPGKPAAGWGGREGAGVGLEVDTLCALFEGVAGFLRFRVSPRRPVSNVEVCLEGPGGRTRSRQIPRLWGTREVTVQVGAQVSGGYVWSVGVGYDEGGRRRRWEGEIPLVVVRPQEAQRAADQLTLTISNHIENGHASDVNISGQAVDDLLNLSKAENPYKELRALVTSNTRVWSAVTLDEAGETWDPGPMPAGSRADRVTLDFGTERVHFFAGREVTLGRQRAEKGGSDIALRHPNASSLPADSPELEPYLRASKRHCTILAGEGMVRVRNGCRGTGGEWEAPRSKLYWGSEAVEGERTLAAGAEGTMTLGALGKGVQVEVSAVGERVCCPGCPDAERGRCGGGWRSCAEVRRRDGAAERYVGLWGCYPLGRVDPMWGNVTIQRREGGFAWRRGGRCGWLEPGKDLATEFGTIKVK